MLFLQRRLRPTEASTLLWPGDMRVSAIIRLFIRPELRTQIIPDDRRVTLALSSPFAVSYASASVSGPRGPRKRAERPPRVSSGYDDELALYPAA